MLRRVSLVFEPKISCRVSEQQILLVFAEWGKKPSSLTEVRSCVEGGGR